MATDAVATVYAPSSGTMVTGYSVTIGSVTLFLPKTAISDPINDISANVKAVGDDAGSIATYESALLGTWGYTAGSAGTVNSLPSGARIVGITAHATNAGATLTINAGASVPVPANTGIAITPRGNLVAPTLVFTGTDSYFVEYLT